jgi:hypothetical protein
MLQKISINFFTIKQAWKEATNNLFNGIINIETHIWVCAILWRNHTQHVDLTITSLKKPHYISHVVMRNWFLHVFTKKKIDLHKFGDLSCMYRSKKKSFACNIALVFSKLSGRQYNCNFWTYEIQYTQMILGYLCRWLVAKRHQPMCITSSLL